MADPLTLLRQFNINKRDVSEKDDQIIFGEFSYPKNVKTNYMVYKAGEGTTKDYYTLEALHFILKNVSIPHPIYVQKAAAAKVPVVNRVDRKALLAYLNGDTDTSASIDKSAPLELGASRAAQVKRPAEDTDIQDFKKAKVEVAKKESQIQQEKNALAARFDAPRPEPSIGGLSVQGSDVASSLSEAMSVETIAAIKAKRFAKKRSTIRGVPEEDIDNVGLENRAFIDSEIDVTRDIISKERILRNRNNILQSVGRTFTNILSIIQVKSKDNQTKPTAVHNTEDKSKIIPKSYSRYEQERFTGVKVTEEFNIDTLGGFASMKKSSSTPSRTPHKTPPRPAPPSRVPVPVKPNKSQKRESKTPIIIVPAAMSSLLNLYNVRDFLQETKFITAQEKQKQGYRKVSEVMIQRKRDLVQMNLLRGHTAPIAPSENQVVTIPYRIIDCPGRLEKKDWDRVVAVFVAGPQWQFKGWPWLTSDGSPVHIFTRMKAFHLKYEEYKVDKNILTWDVTVLSVSQQKRHLDSICALKFWEHLDKFITKNKRHLRF